jgi:hypothetical protein
VCMDTFFWIFILLIKILDYILIVGKQNMV